jgi:hypothetical protein
MIAIKGPERGRLPGLPPRDQGAPGAIEAEAVVRHARMPERTAPAAVSAAERHQPDEAKRWPPGLRLIFLIITALLSWAALIFFGWWLLG